MSDVLLIPYQQDGITLSEYVYISNYFELIPHSSNSSYGGLYDLSVGYCVVHYHFLNQYNRVGLEQTRQAYHHLIESNVFSA